MNINRTDSNLQLLFRIGIVFSMQTILSGIKPSGTPHLGNYLGMLKPSLELMKRPQTRCFYFMADIHALNTIQNRELLRQYTYEAAAAWIALGLDPHQAILYRESDIPEISELNSLLAHAVPKSLMNQAHAYKAITQKNQEAGNEDLDDGVNMGLFNYPILMSADILAFDTDFVPVGKDQVQHLEITRDIARRFNVRHGECLKLPQVIVKEEVAVIPGLDGRKMSKSYENIIALFQPEKEMLKCINRIVTDTSPPEAPKDPDSSSLFAIYQGFAAKDQIEEMRAHYAKGIGWGQMKKELFEVIRSALGDAYKIYQELMSHPEELDRIFNEGAKKARAIARPIVDRARNAVGF